MISTTPMSVQPPKATHKHLADGWSLLQETGFVQLSTGPLPSPGLPFVVCVRIPLVLLPNVPFYLHIVNDDHTFEIIVSGDDLVDEFLSYMPGLHMLYAWAEIGENGELHFDTVTPCPAQDW